MLCLKKEKGGKKKHDTWIFSMYQLQIKQGLPVLGLVPCHFFVYFLIFTSSESFALTLDLEVFHSAVLFYACDCRTETSKSRFHVPHFYLIFSKIVLLVYGAFSFNLKFT